MPSTTIYRRGDVIVVQVPFSNASGAKPRPALVLSTEPFHRELADVIVCPISSRPRFYRRPGGGDCPLQQWQPVGLRHPSTARISKLLAVDKQIIKRILGAVEEADLNKVVQTLRTALGL